MSLIGQFQKTPIERLDYEIDLGPELAGDQIANIAWVSSAPWELVVGTGPNGLPAPSMSNGKAKVWLGGGVAGKFYTVSANVQTVRGRVLSRGFAVQMTDDQRWQPSSPISTVSSGLGQVTTTAAWLTPSLAVTVLLVLGLGVFVYWRTKPGAKQPVAANPALAPAPTRGWAPVTPIYAAPRSRRSKRTKPHSQRRTKQRRTA